jgi:hypothetical protein
MLVDVAFDGVPVAKGATARPEGNGWFVELEQPMPVGTRLDLSGETAGRVRVARVVEGVGAGMWLVPADAKAIEPAPAVKQGPKPDKSDAKPDAKADAKPDAKADAKSDAKADAKSDAKADSKSDAKAGARADAKVDAKAEAKADDDDGDDEGETTPAKATNGAGRDRRKKPRKPPTGA